MRSRYSAFALGLVDYLTITWHPRTRPTSLVLDGEQVWERLDVLSASAEETVGMVEFVAAFRRRGVRGTLHEVSTFQRRGGRWFYLDGVTD